MDEVRLSTGVTRLVEGYRIGVREAGEELLLRFQPYLTKWQRLLILGRWDGRDREVAHLLKMLGGPGRPASAAGLAARLRCYEAADLEQEVRLTLLEAALKARSIRKQYRYLLRDRLAALLRDPLTRQTGGWPPLEEEGERLPAALMAADPGLPLNAAWVEGATCGPGFDLLTAQERNAVRHTKGFGYSVEETAARLGISASTVDRAVRRAKRALAIYYR